MTTLSAPPFEDKPVANTSHHAPPAQLHRNIAAIAAVEQAAMAKRTLFDRLADGIARFAGGVAFLIIHVVWFVVWLVLNSRGRGRAFDPYPFSLLTLTVSLEAIFLATFVLISQNRAARIAERRAHLDLQINLLAESEMTKVLTLVRAITAHLHVAGVEDAELRDLARRTDVKAVIEALEEQEEQEKTPVKKAPAQKTKDRAG